MLVKNGIVKICEEVLVHCVLLEAGFSSFFETFETSK